MDTQTCPICLEALSNAVKFNCGHIFCIDCAKTYYKQQRNRPVEYEDSIDERVVYVDLEEGIYCAWHNGQLVYFPNLDGVLKKKHRGPPICSICRQPTIVFYSRSS